MAVLLFLFPSIVFSLQLEIIPGMGADGAYLGGLLAHMDVATVGALPNHVAIAGEDNAALHVGQQLQVAFLVLLLDLGDLLKQESDMVEAFLLGLLGHGGVHIGPLVILTLCGSL